jgi:hypothetical protein
MGCCTTTNDQGVGQVSLLHIPSTGIKWVGLESNGSGITTGFSGTAPTHIVWIDLYHGVDIEVAGVDTILIHNDIGATRTGNVTLIW